MKLVNSLMSAWAIIVALTISGMLIAGARSASTAPDATFCAQVRTSLYNDVKALDNTNAPSDSAEPTFALIHDNCK